MAFFIFCVSCVSETAYGGIVLRVGGRSRIALPTWYVGFMPAVGDLVELDFTGNTMKIVRRILNEDRLIRAVTVKVEPIPEDIDATLH